MNGALNIDSDGQIHGFLDKTTYEAEKLSGR